MRCNTIRACHSQRLAQSERWRCGSALSTIFCAIFGACLYHACTITEEEAGMIMPASSSVIVHADTRPAALMHLFFLRLCSLHGRSSRIASTVFSVMTHDRDHELSSYFNRREMVKSSVPIRRFLFRYDVLKTRNSIPEWLPFKSEHSSCPTHPVSHLNESWLMKKVDRTS